MDKSTFSNYTDIVTTHIDLDLHPNFAVQSISGTATLTMRAARSGVTKIVLDTRALRIDTVHLVEEGGDRPLEFALGAHDKALGRPLRVVLPAFMRAGETCRVRVAFATGRGQACTALQWLSTEQTGDKVLPYLFSQCQAIHARSMLPCQDTPSVKAPYAATLVVPAGMTGLMSAVAEGVEERPDGGSAWRWVQKVPIPSYLIALCAGRLESRDLGPRCRVWAEPGVVDASAREFEDMEKLLRVAEEVCGPYVWGRYDLLVLPPSFPYGGMENPCLTFVTPTLLAGDKSLVNVCAHEAAHSWTGNLVTNRTWADFWMNEGFTVYVERKIVRRFYGDDEYNVSTELGYSALGGTVERFGCAHQWTCLHWPLDGEDPDDAFSRVPYEKGYCFLRHLEALVGGEEKMIPFLQHYLREFAYKTVVAEDLRVCFEDFFRDSGVDLASIDWDDWLHTPGMPPKPHCDPAPMAKCAALAEAWLAADAATPGEPPVSAGVWEELSCNQRLVALDTLGKADTALSHALVAALDATYGLARHSNAELRCAFLLLALGAGAATAVEPAIAMAAEQGRMKFVRPLYRAIAAVDDAAARAAFAAHRNTYHAIAAKMIARDLGVADDPVEPSASTPLVGVIMGSDSDLPCMVEAVRVLESLGVPHEVTIVSAHRTPDRLVSYARGARDRGIKVIVAGAGGAAHLPGMVAAMTPLPVIGVPVKSSALGGNDSLLSIVQMPRGVPVATVAIGNATNAGLLAARILGVADSALLDAVAAHAESSRVEVEAKAAALEAKGAEAYLAGK